MKVGLSQARTGCPTDTGLGGTGSKQKGGCGKHKSPPTPKEPEWEQPGGQGCVCVCVCMCVYTYQLHTDAHTRNKCIGLQYMGQDIRKCTPLRNSNVPAHGKIKVEMH